MKDLQIAIADYVVEHDELELSYQLRPSVETLPETDNGEGDVRLQLSDNKYYVYNEGWDFLMNAEIDITFKEEDFATEEEILAMLKEGEELAKNGS